MDNFEDKFLEELAKAQARLSGKEPYDDAAIEKEFDPDAEIIKPEKERVKKVKAEEKPSKPVQKEPEKPTKTTTTPTVKKESAKVKTKVSKEKSAVIYGAVSVAVSFVLSCLGLLVESASPVWQTFEAYMPFIGIVSGAIAVISGALLIKKSQKGTLPLILGLLAIFISVFVSSVSF